MFGLGTPELIIIMVIMILLFGASKLPEIGKGMGEAIKNFKKSISGHDEIKYTSKKTVEEKKQET